MKWDESPKTTWILWYAKVEIMGHKSHKFWDFSHRQGEFLAVLLPPLEDIFEDANNEHREDLNSPLKPREHWNPGKPVSYYLAQMMLGNKWRWWCWIDHGLSSLRNVFFFKDVCFCTFLHTICLEDLLGMSLGGLRFLFTDSIIWASEADEKNVILSILHVGVSVPTYNGLSMAKSSPTFKWRSIFGCLIEKWIVPACTILFGHGDMVCPTSPLSLSWLQETQSFPAALALWWRSTSERRGVGDDAFP